MSGGGGGGWFWTMPYLGLLSPGIGGGSAASVRGTVELLVGILVL